MTKPNPYRLRPAIGLKFPNGDIMRYKGTNIPQIFFSAKKANEAAKKWHPELHMTKVSIKFIITEYHEPIPTGPDSTSDIIDSMVIGS